MGSIREIAGRCVLPDGSTANCRLTLSHGRIARVNVVPSSAPTMTAPEQGVLTVPPDYLVAPGLIDLQVNGGVGGEFRSTPTHLAKVASFLLRHGVTAFLPTVTSIPFDRAARLIPALFDEFANTDTGATPLGLHIEGPLLAPKFRGGHPLSFLSGDVETYIGAFGKLQGIRLITVAPEIDGVISRLIPWAAGERGIKVGLGHTNATDSQVRSAVDAGAGIATHLFNAMPAPSSREAGLAGVVLGGDVPIAAGLIADMIHVSKSMVQVALNACLPNRLFLVSDASAVTGLPAGPHRFEDRTIVSDGESARLESGVLVGSVLTLDRAVRNLVSEDLLSAGEAIRLASTVPADVIGDRERGSIAEGRVADFVIFRDDLTVAQVIQSGEISAAV